MRLRNTLVGAVTEPEIAALLENQVGESRILDYKLELLSSSSSDRTEFLADVSALANTAGGVIVYGVKEGKGSDGQNTGIPESIPGIAELNAGSEELRLTSMMLDGISPPIGATAKFQAIRGPEGKPVLLIGIPQSFAGPHMVTLEKSNKFWRRSESGKYSPGVSELRSMFNEQRTWRQEVEDFRRQRVDLVHTHQVMPVERSSATFIHVLPVGRLDALIDLKKHETSMLGTVHPPSSKGGFAPRWNADGFLKYVDRSGGWVEAYTQWFRFGGVEGFSSRFISERDTQRYLWVEDLITELRYFALHSVRLLAQAMDRAPPYAITLSMLGTSGAVLGGAHLRGVAHTIQHQRIFFSPVILESADNEAAYDAAMQPLYDAVWQCGGVSGAPDR